MTHSAPPARPPVRVVAVANFSCQRAIIRQLAVSLGVRPPLRAVYSRIVFAISLLICS